MSEETSLEPSHGEASDKLPDSTTLCVAEAAIHALEQQVACLEEACYDALRMARDATWRAGDLGLQALQARIRLCALAECEPLRPHECTSTSAHQAVLRLTHLYFDDPGKYRMAVYHYPSEPGAALGSEAHPLWCSQVVYDSMRPEGHARVAISDAIRKAYQVAEQHGSRFVWTTRMESRWQQPLKGPQLINPERIL